jgi:peptidoglycan-associated lipoprotein
MSHRRIHLSLAACGALAFAAGCAAPAASRKSVTDVNEGSAAGPMAPRDTAVARGEGAGGGDAASRAVCALDRVHFAFDSAQLDESARGELKGAASCLAEKRPADVLVEGHCDERGTSAYNLALGNKRAAAVKGYLADLGVAAPMKTISFGKELPAVQGHDEAAWRENRRAELKLPGERRSDGAQVASR